MSKKIVAIGGGGFGIDRGDYVEPNSNAPIMKEIINLSEKKNPTFLYLAHSIPNSVIIQKSYYLEFRKMLKNNYDCNCIFLSSKEIADEDYARKIVNEADVIYEDGGNTLTMMYVWQKYNFDKVLKDAYENGKVMSGLSAGANCWFDECSSDSLKIMYGWKEDFITLKCLGLHEGFFVPHCDEAGRKRSTKTFLKHNNKVGILVSNGAAIEIVDNKYRIITGIPEYFDTLPYASKAYFIDDEYHEEKLDLSKNYKDVSELLKKRK